MLARSIISLFPKHQTYVEPFAGGAAVLFAKDPAEREILNDLDGDLVRFWRALREQPEALADLIAATPYSREEWERSRPDPDLEDLEAARRFLVEVDQSFGRSRVSWIVGPWKGRYQPKSWSNLPPLIIAAADRLRTVAIENTDALDLIERCDRPGALLYLDPPYAGEDRQIRKGYAVDRADLWDDLVPLLLSISSAAVVLSGYPCEQSDLLEEAGWSRKDFQTKRIVQSKGKAQDREELNDAPETIWISPGVESEAALRFDFGNNNRDEESGDAR